MSSFLAWARKPEHLTEEGKSRVVESLNRSKEIIESFSDKIKIKE